MYYGEASKEAQRDAHAIQEILQEFEICPNRMVEVAMVHHVDTLALVEFTLDVEEKLVHCSALDQFIDEPEIFLVVDRLDQHADVFLFLPRAVLPDQLGHL